MTKTYGRRPVLREVDLELATGSTTIVTGANAAGKTTLLRLFSTYARPTSGEVRWVLGGSGLEPQEARARIGYAGHVPLVYDELTPRENVEFLLRMRGVASPELSRRADDWLGAFGMTARAEERVAGFSRGLRQRVALACAFAPQPEFLLLDEPTANLDMTSVLNLEEALARLRGKATTVIATHHPEALAGETDRLLELRDGTLRETGR